MTTLSRHLATPEDTERFGAALAAALPEALLVALEGPLGAGKTSLVRACLRGLGHRGPVRSPTYTLIEPYQCAGRRVFHLDLYRLAEPEELEYIGVRDIFAEPAVVLVEWPERGADALPAADLRIRLSLAGQARAVRAEAETEAGERVNALLEVAAPD